VIGLVLALAVVAIIVSLVGHWIVGIAIGVVALILFALALASLGRRSTSPRRP
jgi:beta-lactamase regulating signal transducer with metallopeptidase domain